MNELLKILLSLSLAGTLCILILLLCKPFVKDKLSKTWQYYIWLVVVARLLLPFTPEASLMGTLFERLDAAAIQAGTSARPEQNSPVFAETDWVDPGEGDTGTGAVAEPAKRPIPNISAICLLVWLVIAFGLMIRKVTIYQSFIKYIKAGRMEVTDMALWECVGKLVEQSGIKGAVGLYTNRLISSPLLTGFFRPCIILPTAELPDSDFYYTILHELTHYKRRDMLYKWLVQVTVCLHWFNPFVYLMSREVNKACELACDEAIMKPLDSKGRRDYGDTLLNAVKTGGVYKDAIASVTLSESTALLKERLDCIMRFKQKSKFTVAVTCFLSIILIFGFAFIGAYAGDFKAAANPSLQSMRSATTMLNTEQDITALEVRATVGNLTVVSGEKPQIEIGAKLIGHASFSCKNGTLVYRDDLESNSLSFGDLTDEAYKITITIPDLPALKKLTVDVGLGFVALQNIKADDAELTGTGIINLDGFQSGTLRLHSTLADIHAADIAIQKELGLYSYGSTATVSGTIKGNVLIESAGISNTNISFLNSVRTDYCIKSAWEPEAQHKEPGDLLLETGTAGILIDGKRYPMEYADSNLQAPYKLTIISRELMPMENITVSFIN